MKIFSSAIAILFGAMLATAQPLTRVTGPGGAITVQPAHPSRLLVRFRGSPALINGSAIAHGFRGDPQLFVVTTPSGQTVAQTLSRYRSTSAVLYAEPDYQLRIVTTPGDPLWNQQWDMTKISAPAAWDLQTDAGDAVVAVIDTGIDYNHPDLIDNLWTASGTLEHGYSCFGGCVAGGTDDYGHGTHVAGTIGASANNGAGIAGINWKIQLLSIKFLDSNGSGWLSDAVLAFDKVSELRQAGYNIRVTNNSWGGGSYMQSLKDAMARAENLGVLHACAAGNSSENTDFSPMYPGAYDNRGIISVLATDVNDSGAYFTNYGLFNTDIAAPGVDTLSTVPTTSCRLCDPSGYKFLSGTSMATPHVAGAAAALLHKYPALTAAQARDVLLDPRSYDLMTETKAGWTSSGGRLNLYKLLTSAKGSNPGPLNQFPTMNFSGEGTYTPGSTARLSVAGVDPDGDSTRVITAKTTGGFVPWLQTQIIGPKFPDLAGTVSFTAPTFSKPAVVRYDSAVSDNRGGGALASGFVGVTAGSSGGGPVGVLSAPSSVNVDEPFTINYHPTDPEGGAVLWDFYSNSLGVSINCCYAGTDTVTTSFSSPGVWRIGATAMDQELNTSRSSAVVHVGGAVGEPPLIKFSLDKDQGLAPLTVTIDMRASTDADGFVANYGTFCNFPYVAATITPTPGVQTCTFDKPGSYWVILEVSDDTGLYDATSVFVTALPSAAPPPPPQPPTVAITYPANGSVVQRRDKTQHVDAAVTNGTAARVDITVNGSLLCSDSVAPYSCQWNVPAAANKSYMFMAKTFDAAGNMTASSPAIVVTVK